MGSNSHRVFGQTSYVGLVIPSLPPDVLDVDVILSENDVQLLFDGDYHTPVPVPAALSPQSSSSTSNIATGSGGEVCNTQPLVINDGEAHGLQLGTTATGPAEVFHPLPINVNTDTPGIVEVFNPHNSTPDPGDIFDLQPCITNAEVHTPPVVSTRVPDAVPISVIGVVPADWDRDECIVCDSVLEPLFLTCISCKYHFHPRCGEGEYCHKCCLVNARNRNQKRARDAQEKQAKKMLKLSEGHHPPLVIGDNVRVTIPNVDRGPSDPGHLVAVVTAVTVHGKYKVGTKAGLLKGTFARNALEKCKHNVFLSPENVPDTELSLRQAVTAESVGNGQGHVRCKCTTGCKDGRCSCRKANRLCNSYCHSKQSCKNKG